MMLREHFHHSYLIAFVKPASHREMAPREFVVHSRWKPEREAEEKRRKEKKRKKKRKKKQKKKRKQKRKKKEK